LGSSKCLSRGSTAEPRWFAGESEDDLGVLGVREVGGGTYVALDKRVNIDGVLLAEAGFEPDKLMPEMSGTSRVCC